MDDKRLPVELEKRLAEVKAIVADDGSAMVTEDGAILRLERRGMLDITASYINGQALVTLTPDGEDYAEGRLARAVEAMRRLAGPMAVKAFETLIGS